ncbi:MAG: hypothetical protein JL50_05650 [Peptococcaceae bacterium BICA1-7]|nr:MAG: hypothetical protein JL50_05650 [Peptococcaceae bacterium BICA1-7]
MFNKGRPGLPKVLFLALFIIIVLLPGCGRQAAEIDKPLPVVTAQEVLLTENAYSLQTTGVVEPWEEARLSFQVPGKIQWGPLEEGAVAAAGEVMARLDDADYRAQENAARSELEMAGVEVDRTGADLERYEKLFSSGAISQKSLDDARFAFRAADARAKQAASGLRQAELTVEHSILAAPFSGKVINKLANRGEMVSAGTPVLVLAQLNPVKISLAAPANEIDMWDEGAGAWVDAGGIPAAAGSGSEEKIEAVVHKVSPGAEGMTGTFRVELKVENKNLEMRPGQVVKVDRQVKTKTGLWIPLKSVVSRGQELKYVFVLDPSGPLVRQREVKLGPVVEDRVEVVSGLEPGSRIIVLMAEDLRDGDRVEVK